MNSNLPVSANPAEPPANKDEIAPKDKDDQLIENYLLCRDWYQAGVATGYSDSYSATKLKYVKLANPKFVDKIHKAYKNISAGHLLDIAEIEKAQLKRTLKDPNLYKTSRHACKEIKQQQGLLKQVYEDSAPVINIAHAQNLMLQVHKAKE